MSEQGAGAGGGKGAGERESEGARERESEGARERRSGRKRRKSLERESLERESLERERERERLGGGYSKLAGLLVRSENERSRLFQFLLT